MTGEHSDQCEKRTMSPSLKEFETLCRHVLAKEQIEFLDLCMKGNPGMYSSYRDLIAEMIDGIRLNMEARR